LKSYENKLSKRYSLESGNHTAFDFLRSKRSDWIEIHQTAEKTEHEKWTENARQEEKMEDVIIYLWIDRSCDEMGNAE
jgi:hypothetical protein